MRAAPVRSSPGSSCSPSAVTCTRSTSSLEASSCSKRSRSDLPQAGFSFLGTLWRDVGTASEVRITKQLHLSPSDLSELIVSMGGVKFWIVSVVPLYVGWVLAQAAPARHLFIDDLRVVLGIIVVGPLLGTFTLLLNVYFDMKTTDRVNPRKKYVQVVEELIGEGLMERDTLLLAAFGFAAMAVVIAAYVSGPLVRYGATEAIGPLTAMVGTQGFLLLGWILRLSLFNGPAYAAIGELWPFLALQVLFYAVFIRRATVGRIWALLLFLSILQGLGVLLMLWRFVGGQTWAPP